MPEKILASRERCKNLKFQLHKMETIKYKHSLPPSSDLWQEPVSNLTGAQKAVLCILLSRIVGINRVDVCDAALQVGDKLSGDRNGELQWHWALG